MPIIHEIMCAYLAHAYHPVLLCLLIRCGVRTSINCSVVTVGGCYVVQFLQLTYKEASILCTYMDMCVGVLVSLCGYVCTYACGFVYPCTCICIYVCGHVCMYIHLYVCTYVCTYVCGYLHTYMYVCMYVRRCLYSAHIHSWMPLCVVGIYIHVACVGVYVRI